MHYIKKKYSFTAEKEMNKEDSGGKLNKYQTVLYCEHCHKMDWLYKYLLVDCGDGQVKNITEDMVDFSQLTDDTYYSYMTVEDAVKAQFLSQTLLPCKNEEILDNGLKIIKKGKATLKICPSCHKEIRETMFLTSTQKWRCDNTILYAYGIERDGEKVILNTFSRSIYPATKVGKLKYLIVNCRFIFNTKTKQIYAMQPYEADGKKPLFKEAMRIVNITHYSNSSNFITGIQSTILNDKTICNYLIKELGLTVYTNEPEFRDVAIAFRYRNIGQEAREIINSLCDDEFLKKSTTQKRKRILQQIFLVSEGIDNRDSSSFFDEVDKKKCPDKKKFRKMCMENPFVLYMYSLFRRLGMRNYDLIMEVVSIKPFWTWYIRLYTDMLSYGIRSKQTKIFLKAYIKNRGEHALKNELVSLAKESDKRKRGNIFYLIEDCASLYFSIGNDSYMDRRDRDGYDEARELNLNKENLKLIEWDTFDNMHQSMSMVLTKIRNRNMEIPYYEDDLKLNGEHNGVLFRLAPDTHSLIDCGHKMGICVGGYGHFAMQRSCVIVFMIEPGSGKFIGCIELNSNISELKQAKAKYNGKLTGEAADALKEWVEENSINTKNCMDYKHIENRTEAKQENEWNYNFDVGEPVEEPDDINFGWNDDEYAPLIEVITEEE